MRKKILIAEDDPAILDAARITLQEAGYEVLSFHSGDDLLDDEFELPDLFILDKQLSGVDGLDICRHLKTSARSSKIPVIMMSASPQVRNIALRAGADEFLEKPFSIMDLRRLVAAHLQGSTSLNI